MININLKSLVGKLNQPCRLALEGAAGLCMSRTHYNVEVEHWLSKLLESGDTDIIAVLDNFDINLGTLTKDLNDELDHIKTGNSRAPALSPTIVDLAKNAWMLASIEYGHGAATSAHILAALLMDESLRRTISSQLLLDIPAESLREVVRSIVGTTAESATASVGDTSQSYSGAPAALSKSPSLDKFTVNLTQSAREGRIDAVLGRDEEIRQIVDILIRRRQNNPILTGEAGVGKTAVVEGFAMRIASGDVPDPLKGVTVRSLDLGLLQAGASVKGEFENRLKSVIAEVKASPDPIIMFIDEAHTLIGAGGKEGQGDAANLLKPALARGELRTIAATTWAEYKKYFERDPASASVYSPSGVRWNCDCANSTISSNFWSAVSIRTFASAKASRLFAASDVAVRAACSASRYAVSASAKASADSFRAVSCVSTSLRRRSRSSLFASG